MEKFKFTLKDDIKPICPHCEKELTEVYARYKGAGFIEGRDIIYFCPHCRKVLGLGQSRMI